MKNYFKYMAILALGVVSCEADFENSIEDQNFYAKGQADFSNYVALGNSLTAGYADGALYITGQENAYPKLVANQFSLVQDTEEFTIPYVNDNAGGLTLGGNVIADTRYVLAVGAAGPSPQRYRGAAPTTEVTNTLEGPFNNMGVPGAKSFHLVAEGYGNVAGVPGGVANPYFARFATSPGTSVIKDALMQEPTFFSLWIGNNDVLGYATSGGVGVDQTNNTDPSTYGPNDITDPNVFGSVYSQMVENLSASASGGVLINIPDVTSVPYFTAVPNDALDLEAEQAAQLTAYFQAVSQIFAAGLMQKGVPQEQAAALAAQYAISFKADENRFLIDVPKTEMNPLGFRQMTEEELLLLTIDRTALAQGYGSVMLTPEVMQVLGKLQQGQQPTEAEAELVINAVSGIDDKDALDKEELGKIEAATNAYNATISALAEANGLALVDANAVLDKLAGEGIQVNGTILTDEFGTGGAFSLDGIHLTPRGNAVIANEMIMEVNATYGSEVPMLDPGNFGTITYNNEVQ
ncbi:G-D-S-L family lipolytic protein [Salegentibacter chungangensis]|uniref:G-D-S-L family lipolytic protein n=1 Tax=Salegentibacter chungangensis TaxID=1335724 RepID=A0ABW3NMC0_9FLAO